MTTRAEHRAEALDAAIRRMVDILEAGQWPTGMALSEDDREAIEWNLEAARRERNERRRAERARA